MRWTVISVFAFATILAGCTEKTGEPGTEGTVAQDKSCREGSTKNAEAGYCINVPGDLTPSPPAEKTAGTTTYEYASSRGSIVINVRPIDDAQWATAKTGLIEETTRLGGQQRNIDTSISAWWKEADGRTNSTTLLRTSTKLLECKVVSGEAQLLQACQTMRPL